MFILAKTGTDPNSAAWAAYYAHYYQQQAQPPPAAPAGAPTSNPNQWTKVTMVTKEFIFYRKWKLVFGIIYEIHQYIIFTYL